MGDEKHTYLGGQLNRKSIKGIKIERERERERERESRKNILGEREKRLERNHERKIELNKNEVILQSKLKIH